MMHEDFDPALDTPHRPDLRQENEALRADIKDYEKRFFELLGENRDLEAQVSKWALSWLDILLELIECKGKENIKSALLPALERLNTLIEEHRNAKKTDK